MWPGDPLSANCTLHVMQQWCDEAMEQAFDDGI
jgi:hypothetical protein